MNNEYVVISENQYRCVMIRAWAPGDGLTCSHTKSAPRERLCGRPVAVTVTEDRKNCWHTNTGCRRGEQCRLSGPRRVRRIICANHIPSLETPGSIATMARKQATERLAAEHWDTWQRYVAEAMEKAVTEQFAGLDPEVVRLVIAASGEAAAA